MARRHQMTARRRVALRKAQLVSARNRRGRHNPHTKRAIRGAERRAQYGKYGHKRRRVMKAARVGVGIAAVAGSAALVGAHKTHGGKFQTVRMYPEFHQNSRGKARRVIAGKSSMGSHYAGVRVGNKYHAVGHHTRRTRATWGKSRFL